MLVVDEEQCLSIVYYYFIFLLVVVLPDHIIPSVRPSENFPSVDLSVRPAGRPAISGPPMVHFGFLQSMTTAEIKHEQA